MGFTKSADRPDNRSPRSGKTPATPRRTHIASPEHRVSCSRGMKNESKRRRCHGVEGVFHASFIARVTDGVAKEHPFIPGDSKSRRSLAKPIQSLSRPAIGKVRAIGSTVMIAARLRFGPQEADRIGVPERFPLVPVRAIPSYKPPAIEPSDAADLSS